MLELQLPIPELIPDGDYIFRNVHVMQSRKWHNTKTPNTSDFALRPDERGLSVNWDKYCTTNDIFIMIGLRKTKSGKDYQNPSDYKLIKLNVGDVRKISLLITEIIDVLHRPELNNKAHSEICCEDEDEIRLKLCELVESYEDPIIKPDIPMLIVELEKRRV